MIFAHKIVVFSSNDWNLFALLQSTVHEVWARKQASTLETRLSYTPSDVFETLPSPARFPEPLARIAASYHEARIAWMRDRVRGLTGLYNAFHSPESSDADIAELRKLHVHMDEGILEGYGWDGIELDHRFRAVPYLSSNDPVRFTICERARLEILRRLSGLNRALYEDECRQRRVERRGRGTDAREKRLGVIQNNLL
jgi:hypothetical protein